uniref:Spike glycoprotein n=1 Tax=Human coronavirus NL63 TaxID=277944 RepID=UPI0000ED4E97|nr:Chain A, Spike glycoprotein [Human coronavirus NL63]2IEQ_B Chain B, Spike glycoprotein [Human coronavirus NL63]2IEQ_C Chain C, Spike glycoprotein [Human coronavirus NL63]
KAINNIVASFSSVNDAITQTAEAIHTVTIALNKIQDVVNQQGSALNHLTSQLRHNFQSGGRGSGRGGNLTYLNLSSELKQLEAKTASLFQTTVELQGLIDQINSTYVDL